MVVWRLICSWSVFLLYTKKPNLLNLPIQYLHRLVLLNLFFSSSLVLVFLWVFLKRKFHWLSSACNKEELGFLIWRIWLFKRLDLLEAAAFIREVTQFFFYLYLLHCCLVYILKGITTKICSLLQTITTDTGICHLDLYLSLIEVFKKGDWDSTCFPSVWFFFFIFLRLVLKLEIEPKHERFPFLFRWKWSASR